MRCVTTTSFSVIVNGSCGDRFMPSRGLHQGDPLSPFLFLICSEGLSALMRLAMTEGRIKRVKATRQVPSISHLLFVDDSVLFGGATIEGASVLKSILQEYELSSAQSVNFTKSTVVFSKNTTG